MTHFTSNITLIIKDGMGQLHIHLQLFTITPIFFYYNYTCRRVKLGEHGTHETSAILP